MSSKKTHKTNLFSHFFKEIRHILQDIFFVYKNFIHWSISRVSISIWGILLGILFALPIFIFGLVLGFIDGISWLDIIKVSLEWTDPAHSEFLESIAMHPYALVAMMLVMFSAVISFLFAGTYSTFLLARLSLKYVEWKKLDYKKNLYFSRRYITTFLALICWNMVYILAFLFIGFACILAIYLLAQISLIPENISYYGMAIISLIFLFLTSYVIYRILFWYIILADVWKHHELKSARYYIKKSIHITKGSSFLKFITISLIYFVVISPFKSLDLYIEDQLTYMKDAYAFNTGRVWNIEPEELKYYEYITQEYSNLDSDETADRIVFFSRMRIIYFFMSYFLFSGLLILIISSFYRRVLEKK